LGSHHLTSLEIQLSTGHASIAYRKQIPSQRTVGTIGSVWQENTPSKETTGPAKRYENDQSEMRNGARSLSPWTLANWF